MELKRACNSRPCKGGESSKKLKVVNDEWKFKKKSLVLPLTLKTT